MKKLKIYLDTSVISHLDAQDVPEKMADTLKLWEQIKLGKYEACISDITFDELAKCREPKRSFVLAQLDDIEYRHYENSNDVVSLAEKFVDFGILREKSMDDCQHISIAILSQCDIIVSWNFKHIVNPKTIRGVKMVITAEGYKDLMICTPSMLIEGGVFDDF